MIALTTLLTTLQTIVVTAAISALATTLLLYIHVLRPMRTQYRRAKEREMQLAEQQMYDDLTKWIEHECRYHKAPAVQEALKQRLRERREWMEQYQRRQEIAR
jgi:hypothetical protein